MPTYRVEYEKSGEEIVHAPDLRTLAAHILNKQVEGRADRVVRVWTECKKVWEVMK
jgi:hypothetical protein